MRSSRGQNMFTRFPAPQINEIIKREASCRKTRQFIAWNMCSVLKLCQRAPDCCCWYLRRGNLIKPDAPINKLQCHPLNRQQRFYWGRISLCLSHIWKSDGLNHNQAEESRSVSLLAIIEDDSICFPRHSRMSLCFVVLSLHAFGAPRDRRRTMYKDLSQPIQSSRETHDDSTVKSWLRQQERMENTTVEWAKNTKHDAEGVWCLRLDGQRLCRAKGQSVKKAFVTLSFMLYKIEFSLKSWLSVFHKTNWLRNTGQRWKWLNFCVSIRSSSCYSLQISEREHSVEHDSDSFFWKLHQTFCLQKIVAIRKFAINFQAFRVEIPKLKESPAINFWKFLANWSSSIKGQLWADRITITRCWMAKQLSGWMEQPEASCHLETPSSAHLHHLLIIFLL